jgi:5-methylcytosine-specific restriction endonuclease McrA
MKRDPGFGRETRAPTAEEQLAFLRNLRRLLDEGTFTATYKYALLHAIADLCVTRGDGSGEALTLTTRELADQFVRLYWRQAAPFPAAGTNRPLKQNTGRQAAVVNAVREARAEYDPRLGRVEGSDAWPGLLRNVESTVRRMPLWKLQTVGSRRLDFLYEDRAAENPRDITLRPGVAYCFREFYSLITDMVQGAWTAHVRRTNNALLGPTSELREFLFGTDRRDLSAYRTILEDVQRGRCFYCEGRLRGDASAVDHFVPWRRYPFDLAHNFVLAHRGCNGHKGDRLAAVPHLRRWRTRNEESAYDLPRRFDEAGLVHDRDASLRITRWAYEQVATSGGQVWVRKDVLVPLGRDWERVLAA